MIQGHILVRQTLWTNCVQVKKSAQQKPFLLIFRHLVIRSFLFFPPPTMWPTNTLPHMSIMSQPPAAEAPLSPTHSHRILRHNVVMQQPGGTTTKGY